MKIHKLLILSGILALFFVSVFYHTGSAAPRDLFSVTKTYVNNGNSRSGIAVNCSSTTWTQVLPQSITRREAILQTLSTAGDTVCLSTVTDVNVACIASTPGIRLEAGKTYTDNSEAVLYARSATTSVYVYGMSYSDTGDTGDANR